MPLYTYKCKSCSHEFDELIIYEKRNSVQKCKLCESDAERKVATSFGISTSLDPKRDTIYSPKEIDKVVGEEANKKWTGYNERWRKQYAKRQKQRWGDQTPKFIDLPKDTDGKSRPLMEIGDNKHKALKKEFSEALQEHRDRRKEKGLKQFTGPGAIVE